MASWYQPDRKYERTGERPRILLASCLNLSRMRLLRRYGVCYLLSSTSLGDSQGDTEDGVGAKLALVGSAVEGVKELVNFGLVFNIKVLLDQSGAKDGVDVGDGLGNTLASPLSLVTIAELNSLVLTCYNRLQG